jgi:hypothetical protein
LLERYKKMPNDTLSYLENKSEHDLLVILEGFKMLLADSELFDILAEKLDYPDEMLLELREDVNNFISDIPDSEL